jgi:hypothetical protein
MKNDLAKAALDKIEKQNVTIADLQHRLARYQHGPPLSDAIQKAVERPAQPDLGFNKTVGKIMRDGVFQPRDVKKERSTAGDKRTANKDALHEAKGLRKSRFDRKD